MDISSNETHAPISLRRRTGSVAAAVAVVGFAIGCYGAYRVVARPQDPPILLRQAAERMSSVNSVQASSYAGSGGLLVMLRNDGTMSVQVIDAAFARTSAAPPLYIAPELVPPGGEVNVYVAVPGKCFQNFSAVTPDEMAAPVRITVSAQEPGGPIQFVPVQVTGMLAAILEHCGLAGHGS